jgi:hypothetical protein
VLLEMPVASATPVRVNALGMDPFHRRGVEADAAGLETWGG